MVRALAGDSTMTRFFGTAGSVAPGPSRTLTRSDLADPAEEVLVDLQVGLWLGFGGGGALAATAAARSSAIEGSLPVMAPAGISTNRRWRYGKKKIELTSSMNTGRFPSSVRRFVQRSPTSPAVGRLEQVGEHRLLVHDVEHGVTDHVPDGAGPSAGPSRPADGPVRGGRSRPPAGPARTRPRPRSRRDRRPRSSG